MFKAIAISFISGVVFGSLTTGFIILNNKNKALKILQAMKDKAEKELAEFKKRHGYGSNS